MGTYYEIADYNTRQALFLGKARLLFDIVCERPTDLCRADRNERQITEDHVREALQWQPENDVLHAVLRWMHGSGYSGEAWLRSDATGELVEPEIDRWSGWTSTEWSEVP